MVRRARNEMHRGDAKAASPEPLDGAEAAALAAGLRARDPAALALLFERYGSSVHRTLIRIIGSDDPESSDLLHDTFLRAVEHVRRLQNPLALKAWLFGIAVFTAKEWLRARRRMGYPQPAAAEPERPAVSVSPEAREAVRALYQVLGTFPEDERVVFILRFVEKMEHAELADTLGVSISTVRRRIKRAERRFRGALPAFPALGERLKVPS